VTSGRGLDRAAVVALSAMRIGIGATAWIRPSATAKLFGLDRPEAGSPYLWRLFGIRDVVVGTATLRADPTEQRTWVAFGLICDAADGAAAVDGGRLPSRLPMTAAALVAVPAAAVGLGAWLLRTHDDR
jgi:hypothetical protein